MSFRIVGFLRQTAFVLAWIISTLSVGIGTTIILAPPTTVYRESFRDAFSFAPPHIWAIGWLLFGFWAMLTLTFKRKEASLPLYGNGVLTAIFGLFTAPPLIEGAGAIFNIYTFCALALCSLLAGYNIEEGVGEL